MPALRHAWLTFNPASRSARMSRRIEAIRSGLVRFRMQSLPGLCQLYELHYDWTRFWGAGHRRPRPTQAKTLTPVATHCPECGHALWATHSKYRTVTTLDAVTRLTLRVRRCPNPDCPRYRRPCRPESEALVALPHHEFGLDALALVGRPRHAEHRSVPEIHQELTRRGIAIALRSVTNLLDRYDELRALAPADRDRLHALLRRQRRVVLTDDGRPPLDA